MEFKEILLIISYLSFIFCIAFGFYYLYIFKGVKTTKRFLLTILFPAILTLSFPIYLGLSGLIENARLKQIEIEVDFSIDDLEFSSLYEKINNKTNGVTYITSDHKDIKLFVDGDGGIVELSIKVVVFKHNKYYYYTSYFNDNKINLVVSKVVNNIDGIDVYDLYNYLEKLDNFDFNNLNMILEDEVYSNGVLYDISFRYTEDLIKITLANDEVLNKKHIAFSNNIKLEDKIIDVINEYISISFGYLPKEINKDTSKNFDVIKIFGKDYYYKNKDIVEVINLRS